MWTRWAALRSATGSSAQPGWTARPPTRSTDGWPRDPPDEATSIQRFRQDRPGAPRGRAVAGLLGRRGWQAGAGGLRHSRLHWRGRDGTVPVRPFSRERDAGQWRRQEDRMTPTLYDWLGGIAALTRLTTRFYEHVKRDPVLG